MLVGFRVAPQPDTFQPLYVPLIKLSTGSAAYATFSQRRQRCVVLLQLHFLVWCEVRVLPHVKPVVQPDCAPPLPMASSDCHEEVVASATRMSVSEHERSGCFVHGVPYSGGSAQVVLVFDVLRAGGVLV